MLFRSFLSRKIGQFSAPNSSNQENKSFGFLLTGSEPVDNRPMRLCLPAPDPDQQSKIRLVSLRTYVSLNITEDYDHARLSPPTSGETRWALLTRDLPLWRGRACDCGACPYIDMTVEAGSGDRSEDSQKETLIPTPWDTSLNRCRRLYSPIALQGSMRAWFERGRLVDVTVVYRHVFSVDRRRRRQWIWSVRMMGLPQVATS